MLSRFSEVLATAADVLAPPAPRLEDFQYHWKLIQNLYINQDVHSKIRIEDTKVPFHLDKMLQLLVEEENEQPSIVGPCLEKIINKTLGVLECLTVLAGVDHPPGARAVVLTWYTSLLRRIKQPLINHIAIYQPIQRLLILCSDQPASPTEREEVELLLTLCGLVRKNPDLANVFATPYIEERHKVQNVPKEILDILPSKCQIRTPTKNKLFEVDVPIEPVKRVSLVSQNNGAVEEGHLHLVARPHGADCCNETMTSSINGDDNTSCKSQKTIYDVNDKFLLTDLLVNYLMSADNHIVLRACEGIMIVSSLPDDDIANLITSCSTVCESIIDKLIEKYKGIPANIDPSEVDQLKINWGFVQHDFIDKTAVHFTGYRELTSFLSWLDYCDTLMKECHPAVALNLARTFRRNFLEAVVEPALGDLHHTVLITAIVSKCLKVIDSTEFLNEMSNWLVGDGEIPEWPLLHTLIDNCLSENLELSLETLRFFESIIERPAEHSLQRLVLCHVSSRGYHALPGAGTVAPSGTASVDEEREWLNDVSLRRERERNSQVMEQLLHEGNINQQISDALESCGGDLNDAPNIHKIINSFLLLLPKALLSDPVNFSYEELEDPLNYYQTNIRQLMDLTSSFNWPTEAVWPDTTASSTHSYDSRPEADHHLHCRDCAPELQNHNDTDTNQQAENAKTCSNATMHYETCRHHRIVSYKSQQSRDSTETEPEIKLTDDCCQISVFEMDNVCTNNAATCPFSQNLVFRKKDRCCPAKAYDDEEVFYEGPFLRMIFHLLANMPYQPYQINLLLTTIVSKLAMLPHPYLHEYLLNPVLPVSRGTNTLFKVLQEVAKVLTTEVVKIKDYRILLERTRQMLLEAEADYDDSYEHNQLIAALIVLEEFCKDLAGISLVKYLLNE